MDVTFGTLTEARVWIVAKEVAKAKQLARSMRGEGCKVRLASDLSVIKSALDSGAAIDAFVVERNFIHDKGWMDLKDLVDSSESKPWVVVACEEESQLAEAFNNGAEEAVVTNGDEVVLRARLRRLLDRRRLRILLNGLDLIDEQTGLPNKKAFDTAFDREARRATRSGEPLSIGFLKLDFYDEIISEEGTEKAREAHMLAAMALSKTLPRSADFLASDGHGGFMIILPGTGPEGAYTVGEKMKMAIDDMDLPTDVSEVALRVSISGGFGGIDDHHDDSGENLREAALQALDLAIKDGRGTIRMIKARQPWKDSSDE